MNKFLNKNRSLKLSLAGLLFLFVAVFSINASISNKTLKNGNVDFNIPSADDQKPGVIIDNQTPPPMLRQEIKVASKQERMDFYKD